ncbi:MAG: glycosyltransferase family 4 protein [Microlunatus sp.]|nr:glycosyltransferase family 4 protein [Microlunatus sp.]
MDEFAALLARRLASVGWSVSVIKTGAPGGYLAEQLIAEGVQVMEAQSPAELEAALRGLNPDVVSAHAPASWCLGTVRLLKLPIVETLHGAPTPLTTDWRSEPERSTSITAFVAVSQFVRQHYLSGNPQYPADAVITVPIGYDPAARPRADRNISRGWLGLTTEFLFTSLGRCSAEKNTYGLIDAFADMARSAPDSHLLVAGRVDDPNYARHVVKLIGAQPRDVRVRIHLRENTSVVPAVLSASDCFVMDSFYEGWGMASVEALAAGLPIIRSDTGGAVEQVGPNGQRGYLVGNPVGCSGSVTWDSIARWRFSEQPNKAELSSAMLAAVEARDSWSHQRESIASKSMSLFPIADFVRQHAEILERAAAHPDSVAFAQAAGANSPVIRQDGSRP